jgi:hypothetical protein
MAPKRSLALAAEAGKVEFWTDSASAGCMLYLHGASGTDYYYIHLNNDRTQKNDNRGKCVAGTAYAKGLKNGAKVAAGQVVGYVGRLGRRERDPRAPALRAPPGAEGAVDPYPWLQRASRLLFARRAGCRSRSTCAGTVVAVTDGRRSADAVAPSARGHAPAQSKLKRRLLVTVPAEATCSASRSSGARNDRSSSRRRKPAAGRRVDGGRAVDARAAPARRRRCCSASSVSLRWRASSP